MESTVVARQDFFRPISPKEFWIVVVSMPLTIEAVKQIEALLVGISGGTEVSQPPLPCGSRRIIFGL